MLGAGNFEGALQMNRVTDRQVRSTSGIGRLLNRLERERRKWSWRGGELVPTEQAWRAGVAEGLRLAQVAIRKGM
jgi:hypothetical protein